MSVKHREWAAIMKSRWMAVAARIATCPGIAVSTRDVSLGGAATYLCLGVQDPDVPDGTSKTYISMRGNIWGCRGLQQGHSPIGSRHRWISVFTTRVALWEFLLARSAVVFGDPGVHEAAHQGSSKFGRFLFSSHAPHRSRCERCALSRKSRRAA